MPAPSFENNILPLFRPMDIQCMRGLEPSRGGPVLLANYEYMSNKDGDFANAKNVLAYLKGEGAGPRMPYGGPYWSDDNIQLFADWIGAGCPK